MPAMFVRVVVGTDSEHHQSLTGVIAESRLLDDAGEVICRVWSLIASMCEHALPVRVLRSRRPGRIPYEDDYQGVVLEWNRL